MDLERSIKLIGEDNVLKLKKTRVLIVGLGGVGGMALEMLARCGVESMTLIDYDIFEKSNLNRQILSLQSNLGEKKTNEALKRVMSINERCKVKIYDTKLDKTFLESNPIKTDYIIDACDDVTAKVELIKYAKKNNIKIISCCGTGNKLNPLMLTITNVWKTSNDPLAKKLRQCLRRENITDKIFVVTSNERPLVKNTKKIPSLSLVPNAAGILLASYVVNDVINET